MYPLDLVRALQMADSGSGGVKKTVGQLLGTFKDTYGVQGFFTQVHPALPYPINALHATIALYYLLFPTLSYTLSTHPSDNTPSHHILSPPGPSP